tara:strand:+ start:305 stop:517 length:213 start_codon:yes stop_codon:yes gene_type:complete
MTKRQAEALSFLKKFWAENGYSPSYRDIANELSINDSSAHSLINGLKDRGYVEVMTGRARSIKLTEKSNV